MLTKKIETLTKAIGVESRKTKRGAAIREKDSSSTIKYKYDGNIRQTNSSLKRSAINLNTSFFHFVDWFVYAIVDNKLLMFPVQSGWQKHKM